MADDQREQPSLELPAVFQRRPRVQRPSTRSRPALPRIPTPRPVVAALLTGLLVGLLGVGLTWLALRGCSTVRGTASCGDPGLLLLVAIAVAMGLAGRWLLSAWRVPDPGRTSVLAVALTAVLAMLFLLDALDGLLGVVAVPVVAAAAFAVSHSVTSSFTEPGERSR